MGSKCPDETLRIFAQDYSNPHNLALLEGFFFSFDAVDIVESRNHRVQKYLGRSHDSINQNMVGASRYY